MVGIIRKRLRASQVVNDSSVTGANVDDALGTLDTALDGKADLSGATFTGAVTVQGALLGESVQAINATTGDVSARSTKATGAIADVPGRFIVYGNDAGGNLTIWLAMSTVVLDPTNGSEDCSVTFFTTTGGSLTGKFAISLGVWSPGTTGGDKGVGTANFTEYYKAGVDIDDLYAIDGLLKGLTLSNNGSDATNDIDIATGVCADETGARVMRLTSSLTKRLDASWAVGSGNGGRDTGSIANGTWHVWLIMRSDTGVVDALFSTSATAPTMPANYDYKRRIGSIIRVSAAILAFRQNGDRFTLKTPVRDIAVTSPGTSAVLRSMTTPGGVKVLAHIGVVMFTSTAGTGGALYLSDPDNPDTAAGGSTGANNTYGYSGSAVHGSGGMVDVVTNTSSQIRSRVEINAANLDMYLAVLGWTDARGRT